MWPLYVSQLIDASGVRSLTTAIAIAKEGEPDSGASTNLISSIDPELARRAIYRAIAWSGVTLRERDSFFAVDDGLHALVPAALEAGAICIVSHGWGGLRDLSSNLDPGALRRCFVADDHALLAYRRLASFLRPRFDFPVIAVGGSNGKTTTKDMIAHLLGANAAKAASAAKYVTSTPGTNNGWVGVPITLCQPAHTANTTSACVLEIGIDERGAMQQHVELAAPDIAVLTALGVEHLAGLGTHDDAIREELELFAGSKRRVWLADDPALAVRLDKDVRSGDLIVAAAAAGPNATATRDTRDVDTLTYSWRRSSLDPTSLDPTTANGAIGGVLTLSWKGATCEAHVPMPGEHNGRNAALAIGVALAMGGSLESTASALGTFRGPEQRCVVRELASGTILIDDSYNASPSSIDAALDVFASFDTPSTLKGARERLIILGDMLDLGEASARYHEALIPKLASLRGGVHVRLYGEHMSALAPLLGDAPASIGRATKKLDDPSVLVDDALDLDRCVVLVKGSRGMELERVVAHVTALGGEQQPQDSSVGAGAAIGAIGAIGVGIVGSDAEALACVLRAAIAVRPRGERRRIAIRVLDQAMLEGGEVLRRPYHVAVVAGSLGLSSSSSSTENDPERQLAAIAQLFMHVKSVAILPSKNDALSKNEDAVLKNEDGEDEALELLAEVVPPHVETKRALDAPPNATAEEGDAVATKLTIAAISTLISCAVEAHQEQGEKV